ncbi:Lcl C-terminal domain-containing protein [Vibrio cholerae]|uniref:Lcl C-terminal domain-containing protein n=1 Tax=Vibrio cholerae TaxID=666 RepID=UPI00226D9F99|nr:DUF1566 domain-containing protein [Vibrio cholerae]
MITQRNYALLFFLVLCGFLFSLKPTYASDIDGRYSDNGNGTITDNKTNLTWMRCSFGQSWDGKTCIGEAQSLTWEDAIKLKHSFAGSNDWRLPTIDELHSLVYCSEWSKPLERPNGEYVEETDGACLGKNYQKPTINNNVFPNTPADFYWSSTSYAGEWESSPYASDRGGAWLVALYHGGASFMDKIAFGYVRLVRNTTVQANAKQTETLGQYVVNSNGTVLDKETNLTWMRCSLGQQWTGSTCAGVAMEMNWNDALRTAMNYSYAGHSDWRVPTVDELDSLVYCSKGRKPSERPNGKYVKSSNGICLGDKHQWPTINIRAFPNTPESWYWSSSPSADNSNYAWLVNFNYGYVDNFNKNGYLHVRLVRAGQ